MSLLFRLPLPRFLSAFGLPLLALTVALAAFLLAAGGPARAQDEAEPTVQLYAGWNNVLYQGIALPLPDALGDAHSDVSLVWQFDAPSQTWRLWSADLTPSLNSLAALYPGAVVFLRSRVERLWTQPLRPPPEPAQPTVAGLWEVSFTRTTVLFDLQETIRFDETGAGTVTTAQGESSATSVAGASLMAVDQDLRSLNFFRAWPPDTRSGCLSCFRFSIAIRAPDGTRIALETDGAGTTSDLLELVNQLTGILLAALP